MGKHDIIQVRYKQLDINILLTTEEPFRLMIGDLKELLVLY